MRMTNGDTSSALMELDMISTKLTGYRHTESVVYSGMIRKQRWLPMAEKTLMQELLEAGYPREQMFNHESTSTYMLLH